MKIVIITDGNNTLGMGHIYQSITLFNFLQATHVPDEIFFITKSESYVVDLLRSTSAEVIRCVDDEGILEVLRKKNVAKVIFDKLDVSENLASSIKRELGAKLIILTNLTKANDFADVTVLADIGSNFENICSKNDKTGKIEFFGPKYWLLRPEFYKYRNVKVPGKIQKVLLIFGGADPCNFSTAVLNELLKLNSKLLITLVLGSAFKNEEELNSVINDNKLSASTVKILRGVSNVAEIMNENDLIFASPGLSFFEAMLVGTPAILFHQNSEQQRAYNGFIKTYGKDDVSKIKFLIGSNSFIFSTDPFIVKMEIGAGKDEIIREIISN